MLSIFDDISAQNRIIVALDCSIEKALDLAKDLQGSAQWLKVGMTLFYEHGPYVVHALKELGFKIFLDLKFHDIPHQVEGGAASAIKSGADMITMHTVGGSEMMKAAQRGTLRASEQLRIAAPITLGITVLTSMNQESLEEIGIKRELSEQVSILALDAKRCGLSGVVASPHEASLLRETLGPDSYIVTPGVRPIGSDSNDQSRVATPSEALKAGASHIVIGRPITQSDKPRQAFEDIVLSIQ